MRFRRLPLLAVLGLALALALVAAGCGGDEEASPEEAIAETTGPSGEPIKIGASLPLTGEFSEPGKASREGYEVWEKVVNDAGGLLGRPVEIVIRDDASQQNLAVTNYTNLISRENVDLLLGTFTSFLNLPTSAVAERNEMVFICPACAAPDLFERGFHFLFYAKQTTAPDDGNLFAEWLSGLPEGDRPKTAAYVSQDDPFAAPVIDGLQEKLEAAGVETVFDELYPPETRNFDTIANSIAAQKPDLIAQGSIFEDAAGLVRSLIKVGYNPRALFQTSAPAIGQQYADAVGAGNTEGVFSATAWDDRLDTPMNAEFVEAYTEMTGREPGEDAASAFAAAQVLQEAVEAVGGVDDQRALADWLHANEVPTILGNIRWDEAGRPQGEALIAQWQGPSFEIVLPDDLATAEDPVYPKPDWAE